MKQPIGCAACGAKRVFRVTTFLVGHGKYGGEYSICDACWKADTNDEDWNDKITNRIIRSQRALNQ